MPNEKYYAVAKGRTPGIYMQWDHCEAQVKGYSNNSYKSFSSVEGAKDYVVNNGGAGGSSSQGQSGGGSSSSKK